MEMFCFTTYIIIVVVVKFLDRFSVDISELRGILHLLLFSR